MTLTSPLSRKLSWRSALKKAIAIASSDWHLDKNAWARYPAISGDSYHSLNQIVDYCLAYKVPLLAAGDLFDKPSPDSTSVHEAIKAMDRMQKANLKTYFTEGQHEDTRSYPWLGLHPWPIHADKKVFDLNGYKLIGLDYVKPHNLKAALQVAIGSNIFMCHQVWRNFMGDHLNSDGSLEFIQIQGGLIVTGDYHKHVQLSVVSQLGSKPNIVLSPGSTCMQSIDEPPEKFVYLLYDDLSYDSLPLNTRSVYYRDVLTVEALNDLVSGIDKDWLLPTKNVPENIQKPILAVRFDPDIPDVYIQLNEAVGNKAHLFWRPVVKEIAVKEVILSCAKETIELGLEGNLEKLCHPDSWTYKIARRLLTSDSPAKELAVIQEEYLHSKKDK